MIRKQGLVPAVRSVFSRDVPFTFAIRVIGFGSDGKPWDVAASYYLVDENGQPRNADFIGHNAYRVPGSSDQLIVAVLDFSNIPEGQYTLVTKVMDVKTQQYKIRQTNIQLR